MIPFVPQDKNSERVVQVWRSYSYCKIQVQKLLPAVYKVRLT